MKTTFKDLPAAELTPQQEQDLLANDDLETILLHALLPAVKYIKRKCHERLPDDEILSLCYAALSKSIRNFQPGQQRFLSFSRAYLRGELSKTWREKDAVRNAYRHETPLPKDDYPLPLEENDVQPDFGHYKELWALVEPHIRALPKKEQNVIELRYRFQKTFQEIGNTMGLSRSRIKQILEKSLLRLRAATAHIHP